MYSDVLADPTKAFSYVAFYDRASLNHKSDRYPPMMLALRHVITAHVAPSCLAHVAQNESSTRQAHESSRVAKHFVWLERRNLRSHRTNGLRDVKNVNVVCIYKH